MGWLTWNPDTKRFEADHGDAIECNYVKMYEPWRAANAVWLINQNIEQQLNSLPKESD